MFQIIFMFIGSKRKPFVFAFCCLLICNTVVLVLSNAVVLLSNYDSAAVSAVVDTAGACFSRQVPRERQEHSRVASSYRVPPTQPQWAASQR